MFTERILQKPGMNELEAIIWWFATPDRVALHLLSKVVRATVTPVLHLFLAILVKRMFGLNKECVSADATQLSLLRRYINSILLSQAVQKEAFMILGSHYEIVSVRTLLSGFARRCMLFSLSDHLPSHGSQGGQEDILAWFGYLLPRPRNARDW